MSPGLDLYYEDPAQHPITAGWYLDDLDRDLSDLSDVWSIFQHGSTGGKLHETRRSLAQLDGSEKTIATLGDR